MDSTWMSKCRSTPEFEEGLDKFLERIFSRKEIGGHIYCPCINCSNLKGVDRVEAKSHLLCDGFLEGYKIPTVLLEPDDTLMWDAEDDMEGLAKCIFHMFKDEDEDDVDIPETENQSNVLNINDERFYKVLGDAKKELYPGCKFSVLSFIVRLFHSKCVGKCNEKGFSMILDTMREAFPHASIPKSMYEVMKLIREFGLGYEKIDACPNDCMLYWKQNKDKIMCDVCQTSRYKQSNNNDSEEESTTQADNDGDYKAKKNHESAKEPRNVRLGLASDGFNPFGNMSVSHSTWPVVLISYNLPPWLCMKKPFLFLTLLIPGPSAPGNNIDVYMQPLIDELKELWDTGVNTYNASTKSNFPLRACLIWTISDFPAYTNLLGWSTKGKLACPSCHKETKSIRLSNSHKDIFVAHRHWLEMLHAFHFLKDAFDGKAKHEGPPRC
ncbi:uncharacterized protein [Rutidosis leptorrhynchoides]|uniref:uncharacterized protein n=1 Tax=Rutidosis leptorrhynchoides TaxID=125765 RepID=UPI003A99D621